jgi:hypothetical protein
MSQQPGYSPPPSGGGSSWWKWVIGGCGGCLLIVIIVLLVSGIAVKGFVENLMKDAGPTTPASVQQSLGEVPLYPGGTLELNATQAMKVFFLGIERAQRKKPGTIMRGVAFINTPDDAEKVLAWYHKSLTGLGWKREDSRETTSGSNGLQRAYRKGDELVLVQVQNRRDGHPGTLVMIMRGGPEMTQYNTNNGARQPGR